MENKLKTLDFERNIGQVTLSDGVTVLDVPKLSMLKIIKIVKFLGVDGSKLYNESREILIDENLADLEKLAVILESLKEETLIHIFSILLELDDEQTLQLDINEMLDVALVFVEKTNIAKTFTQVRDLYQKMFKKEMPDFKTLMDRMFPPVEEEQEVQQQKPTIVQSGESIAGKK
ncbi:hypothetical protein [Fictibacillus sp. NRS-1165]|uniref:hypothetical protein n=1 Tax=Fictibacillus sp. NRS-1165 TaxID=3144463 RepID=UPI003D2136EF